MPEPRSFAALLDDADRALAAEAAPAALLDRVVARASAPPRAPVGAITAVATAAVVVVAFVGGAILWPRDTSSAAPQMAGLQAGQLHDGQLQVHGSADADLDVGPRHAVLRRGHAAFTVAPVAAGADPVVVVAGDHTIAVLGTRFDVDVDDGGGRVALHEGRIRLTDAAGVFEDLVAGDVRSWRSSTSASSSPAIVPGLHVTSADLKPTKQATSSTSATGVASAMRDQGAPSEPAATSPSGSPSTSPATSTIATPAVQETGPSAAAVALERVATLRRAGRFDDAIAAVDAALVDDAVDARGRETLSVERGLLLERVGRETEACAHWRRHLASWPAGRSAAAAVAQCDDEVP